MRELMHCSILASGCLVLGFAANSAVLIEIRRKHCDRKCLYLHDSRDQCMNSAPLAAFFVCKAVDQRFKVIQKWPDR